MPIYNLLGYSKNYRKTTGSLWNYYRGQPSDPLSTNSESFKFKISIVGKTPQDNDSLKNVEVVIPLKYLSNFRRNLDILLINCGVEIILSWSKNCVLADMTVDADADPAIVAPSDATFKITNTKLYVTVVALSKENDIKLFEKLKTGFKKAIKWNKYRSKMLKLNYLIDPTFTNVNRLFVLSFERIEDNNVKKDCRDTFSNYYVAKVQIKDFNVLINGKSFFDLPIKNEEKAYKKIIDINNNDETTGNLLDFAYYKKKSRLIAIDLSKQTIIKDPQQINFIGKIEGQDNGVTMFFITERS